MGLRRPGELAWISMEFSRRWRSWTRLLRAVAATGASMLIKVDGERTDGVNPKIFTVVISGIGDEAGPIRLDGTDLGRAVQRAVGAFDTRQ